MENFKKFLFIKKGLQPITVNNYIATIKRIEKIMDLTEDNINNYVHHMYTSDYSYSYKTNTILAIEKYTEFIEKPLKFGRQRKPRQVIKDTLTEAEITKLIFNCNNNREKAIMSILAYSGIRNQEICNLKVKDFLITQNAIRIIQGKMSKDGMSEVTPECSYVVMEYLKEFPRQIDDYLFTTLVRGNKMTTSDIRKWVKIIAKRARVEKRVYPHLFRHSLTANMLLRGADIISLKNQLRHSWIETTLHYANSIVFVEKNLYQKFAPSYM